MFQEPLAMVKNFQADSVGDAKPQKVAEKLSQDEVSCDKNWFEIFL